MNIEIRKDISGFEGLYQVSNFGNIKSLNRKKTRKHGKTTYQSNVSEKILRNQIKKNGYCNICLCLNGKHIYIGIHRLVAEAFIPNPENKRTINHKNGITNDNRVENLERNTYSENNLHAFRELGRKPSSLGKFGKDNPNSKKINQYSLDGVLIKERNSGKDIERELGFLPQNIGKCWLGKRKTAYGYKRKLV